jgi:cytochrome c biogenesis protein CcmG/thiol:disulfide interchange protein DsbE
VTEPQPAPRRPDRRIAALVGVALVTTLAVVAIVAATRPGAPGGSSAPDTIAKGAPVPNITGTTLDGTTVDLSTLRGKPVLINFWGPSCVPCVTEFPLLAAKQAAHAADGLVVLGVLTDDPPDLARTFVAEHGGTWQTVVDPGAAIKGAYRVVARPQTYFVDRDGILRSIQIGELTDADFERQYAMIAGGS